MSIKDYRILLKSSSLISLIYNGSEDNVCESLISDEPTNAIREFLTFARGIVNK